MKTVIICISDPYLDRGLKLKEYYEKSGDEVLILTPDFSHRSKTRIEEHLAGVRYLPHLSYRKNLSFSRMAGHCLFSRTCRKELEKIRPDRIHCLIPANSLAGQMAKYKESHPGVLLVFDIIDMWPESLPVLSRFRGPAFKAWRKMRDSNLQAADSILTECSYYHKALSKQNPDIPFHTLYWMTEKRARFRPEFSGLPETLHLLYLGSVNNVVDIARITELLGQIVRRQPVTLEVIGAGEKKEFMLEQARLAGARVVDHGEIYSADRKAEIAASCHFGLNIVKAETYIGLSMKSLDYLAYGLPVINTVPADSFRMFSDGRAGFNLEAGKTAEFCSMLAELDNKDILTMKKNAASLYDEVFSENAFYASLDRAYQEIGHRSLES